jgi:acetate---CoA ligase (ADP-forming)
MTRIFLRDGRVAELRLAEPGIRDRELIRTLFTSASADSLYLRFFHMVREFRTQFLDDMIGDGGANSASLLCVAGEKALAVGNYARVNETTAEVAFLVDDEIQGKGIGSLLLEHLAHLAWMNGFERIEADVLRENYQMLQVFSASGYEITKQQTFDTVRLVLPLRRTERTLALQETREKLATAASLHPFFEPESIAVIGASRDMQRLGSVLLKHLLECGYTGTVYPVNPSAHALFSVRCYPNVKVLPERIDLAIIAVPEKQVDSVVDDCIEAKVKSVVIISSGFRDADEKGYQHEKRLVRKLRAVGCRLIGPNCLGLLNTHPRISVNASFASSLPIEGGLAIASHSGAIGLTILDYADTIGVGVSSFVSLGNKSDVSSNDLLQYWEDDASTRMIALYLESFGNPRKFSRICRRIARHKPIIAVKGASTTSGLTISKWKGDTRIRESTVDALFRQNGIIRAGTIQELFDIVALLGQGILPKGRRVAIVTNTAGGAVMAVDTLHQEELTFVSPVVNLGYESLGESYREVLPQVLRDDDVDAVVVLFTPVGIVDEAGVVQAIREAVMEYDSMPPASGPSDESASEMVYGKPVVANFLTQGTHGVRYIQAGKRRIPVYPFPEQAVHALSKVVSYAGYRTGVSGSIPDLEAIDTVAARNLIREYLKNAEGRIPDEITRDVLGTIGISVLPNGDGADTKIKVKADTKVEGLKNILPKIRLHVDIDPLFGPLMEVSSLAEPASLEWEDVADSMIQRAFAPIPMTDVDAKGIVSRLYPHLDNFSDAEIACLNDWILRFARLVADVPEINSIHVNPLSIDKGQINPVVVGIVTARDLEMEMML